MQNSVSTSTEDFFNKALYNLKIGNQRKELLESIALFVSKEIKINNNVNLNYICTHNSRRSQIAQVWSNFASHYFKLDNINSFSGGTAVTSFYRNTVKTLQQVGFSFQILEFSHQNPEYLISYKNCSNPIVGFSKMYDDERNQHPFIAITTCDSADINCPFIPEAIQRYHLPYNDPKQFDSTLYQTEKYLETNQIIAGELHFMFKKISELV